MYLHRSAGPQGFCVVCLGCWGSRDGSLISWPPLGRSQQKCMWILHAPALLGAGAVVAWWATVTALLVIWGISCQSTVDFMFLLLKHSFPNRSPCFPQWWNFSIWGHARIFSLVNHELHQKIYCHKKAKLFLGALSGVWNSSPSLELNFPLGKHISRLVQCCVLIPKPFPISLHRLLCRNRAIRWFRANRTERY